MSALIPTIISVCASAILTGVGVYVAMSNRIAVLETQIKMLLDAYANEDIKTRVAVLERDIEILKGGI